MLKIRYILFVFLLLLVFSGSVFAQIGGDPTPLNNSTHQYSILMSDKTNNFAWSIYSGHITSTEIDNNTYSPLPVSYYKVGEVDVNATGEAYVWLTFNGLPTNMPYLGYGASLGTYTLAYKESTKGTYKCERSVVFHFTMYPPLDVDISLANPTASKCPDNSGVPQVGVTSQSTRTYNVDLVYPEVAPGYVQSWQFTLNIIVEGASGASATIKSVVIGATTIADNINMSTYNFDFTAPVGTRQVAVAVTFNDVLGVEQDLKLELQPISAFFSERDADEIDKTPGNIVSDKFFAMPNVGVISALN